MNNIDTYGKAWRDWWNEIQHPLRCCMAKLSLPVAEYKPKQLTTLRCGGEHGLVSVLLGLFWWGALLGTSNNCDAQLKLWLEAVHDFHQCVKVMNDLGSGVDVSGASARKKAHLS